jgi:hypothetical protein
VIAGPKHDESRELDKESDIMKFDEPEDINLNQLKIIKPSADLKIN